MKSGKPVLVIRELKREGATPTETTFRFTKLSKLGIKTIFNHHNVTGFGHVNMSDEFVVTLHLLPISIAVCWSVY